MAEESKTSISELANRIYTNKLLALFILRYAHIREILKVRLINK